MGVVTRRRVEFSVRRRGRGRGEIKRGCDMVTVKRVVCGGVKRRLVWWMLGRVDGGC